MGNFMRVYTYICNPQFFGRDITRIYRGRIEATNSNIRRMGLSWESLGTGREGFNRETRCHSLSDVFLILHIRNVCIYIYIYVYISQEYT